MTDLTDQEIDLICAGLKQNAARVRYFNSIGLTVRQKPNGRPLVSRKHYESVMCFTSSNQLNHAKPIWGVH